MWTRRESHQNEGRKCWPDQHKSGVCVHRGSTLSSPLTPPSGQKHLTHEYDQARAVAGESGVQCHPGTLPSNYLGWEAHRMGSDGKGPPVTSLHKLLCPRLFEVPSNQIGCRRQAL